MKNWFNRFDAYFLLTCFGVFLVVDASDGHPFLRILAIGIGMGLANIIGFSECAAKVLAHLEERFSSIH